MERWSGFGADESEEAGSPRGYRRWARRAASSLTGLPYHSHHEAEDVLLERLAPPLASRIVSEEEGEEFPEDPAEVARHLVFSLHNAVGFARSSGLDLAVEVTPRDEDGGSDARPVEPELAKVRVFSPVRDDPELGFVVSEFGMLQEGQEMLAGKEEALVAYECRDAWDLKRLHTRIYRWLPRTEAFRLRARAEARRLGPAIEELLAGIEAVEYAGAETDLEDEIDAVKEAVEDLRMDLEEVGFDEEEHERFMRDLHERYGTPPGTERLDADERPGDGEGQG